MKKLLSVLLALTMIMGVLVVVPVGASAAETDDSNWITNMAPPEDFEYSIALIGDIQNLTDDYPEKLAVLFEWLRDNTDDLKIKFAVGLGDLTNHNTSAEYLGVIDAYSKIQGVLPFSIIRGNHDQTSKSSANYDAYITQERYGSEITGSFDDTMLNTYRIIEINRVKYMFMNLDFLLKNEVLAWADQIIGQNPDCRVIVSTHIYMKHTTGAHYPLEGDNTIQTKYGCENNADGLWDKVLKKHENVVMMVCGHNPTDNIFCRQRKGDNGNTVTEMLVDPQQTDLDYGGTGLVAMMYFTNGGKNVELQYYSTVKDAYFKTNNQFNITLDFPESTIPGPLPYGDSINSAADFAAMDPDGTYYLASDITISKTYANDFTGTLDGNGKTITTSVPVFNQLNGTVKNLTIAGNIKYTVESDADGYTGALANVIGNTADAAVTNVVNRANITASAGGAGGVVGMVSNGENYKVTFTNVANYGKIDAVGNVGGIVGSSNASSKFVNCRNAGDVTSSNGNAAGIVAWVAHPVAFLFDSCVNDGDITVVANSVAGGGIIGATADDTDGIGVNNVKLVECVNNGDVSGSAQKAATGGMIGKAGCFAGSLDSYDTPISLVRCINHGDISSTYNGDAYPGGMLGLALNKNYHCYIDIYYCGNTGDITGGKYAGGFVARVDTNAAAAKQCRSGVNIIGSFNVGNVYGNVHSAGLIAFTPMSGPATIAHNFVAGKIESGTVATPITSGATVSEDGIYSIESNTHGTLYFIAPTSGTVTLSSDDVVTVTATSSSKKLTVANNDIKSGASVELNKTYAYEATTGDVWGFYSLKTGTVTITEPDGGGKPTITIDGVEIYTILLPSDDGETIENVKTFTTPITNACALVWNRMNCRDLSTNYVLEGTANGILAVQGFGCLWFALDIVVENDDNTFTKAELADGSVAYKLNRGIGKTVFYQDLGKDDYPTTDKTHAKVGYVNGEYVNAEITGANVAVGQDLSIKYYVTIVAEDISGVVNNLSMRFTMNGESVTVAEYVKKNGEYVFAFRGIAPQCMTDNIKAELLYGDEVVDVVEEYSVLKNVETLLAAYPDNKALVQFIVDMLNYGAAAQLYKDYNVETLANAGIEHAASEALPTESIKNKVTADGVALGRVYFTGANVWFDNVNKIVVKLNAYTENTKVVIKCNGVVVDTLQKLTSDIIYTNAIYAVGFEDVYTFELYEGGVLQQTYTYSVASYVYAKMNQTEQGELTEMADLARALYRYGASAVAYVNSRK